MPMRCSPAARNNNIDRRGLKNEVFDFTRGSLTGLILSTPIDSARADAATCATHLDSFGLVTTIPANTPRYEHTILRNLLVRSNDWTQGWTFDAPLVRTSSTVTPPPGKPGFGTTLNTTNAGDFYQDVTGANGTSMYSASIYFSTASTCASAQLLVQFRGHVNDSYGLTFNPSTGALISTTGLSGTVTSVGGGWYRAVLTCAGIDNANTTARFQLNNNTVSSNSLVVYGGQLKDGPDGTYIPTTDTAQLLTTKLGMLFERTATNIALNNADASAASWNKQNLTVTTDAVKSPDGTTTADKLVETAANAQHAHFTNNLTGVANSPYAWSAYVKAGERTRVMLSLDDGAANGVIGEFDLSSGTVVGAVAFGAGSSPLGYMSYVNDGWWRCVITGVPFTSGTIVRGVVFLDSAGSNSYLGDITKGLYVWGQQLEQAPTMDATTVIPTAASSVTRASDAIGTTSPLWSTLLNSPELTATLTFIPRGGLYGPTQESNVALFFYNTVTGGGMDYAYFRTVADPTYGNGYADFVMASGGVGQADTGNNTLTLNAVHRHAVRMRTGSVHDYTDGVQNAATTAGTVPSGLNAFTSNGSISNMILVDLSISRVGAADADLAAMTAS